MQDLENKFEYDLVLRNERVKKSHTVPEQPSKFSRLHFHDEGRYHKNSKNWDI